MNGREVHAEIGNHRRFRPGEEKFNGIVVYFLDLFEQVGHGHAVEILVTASGNLVVRVIPIKLAHETENDVVGIEITARSEVLSGLELDAFSQMKGVFRTVIADFPAFRQCRLDFRGPSFELDQFIEDLPGRSIKGCSRSIKSGVESFRATF